jgi:RNA-directed DNA polymerase
MADLVSPSVPPLLAAVGRAACPGSARCSSRSVTRRSRPASTCWQLNPALRGWCTYFRHGVSARTFGYLDYYAFWRIVGWLRKRHPRLNMHTVVRRFLPNWKISADGIEFFRAETVTITCYRYRGTRIPTPWSSPNTTTA